MALCLAMLLLQLMLTSLSHAARVDTLDFGNARAFVARGKRQGGAPLRKPPPGVCCPPDHFDGLEVGPYELSVTRSTAHGDDHAFGVRKLACRPHVFHLRNLLSERECADIIAAADAQKNAQATTAGGAARSSCSVAWINLKQDAVATALTGVVEDLLLTPEATDPDGWGRGGSFENLQVLRYDAGGEFRLHHDANEDTPRLLTVLLYLNEGGETWFPLAQLDKGEACAAINPQSRQAALALCAAEDMQPGRDGLTVAPAMGDAIAFYNFMDDGSGELDRLAFHAGLPAKAEKRVAALWWRMGDGPPQVPPPKPSSASD